MELKFKQTSEKQVLVIAANDKGEEKEVGHIFTPSGSGNDTRNAIQVCGFTEAFDLWGCSKYQTYKLAADGSEYAHKEPETYRLPVKIFDAFDPKTRNKIIELFREANMELAKRTAKERIKIQCKDIQLLFPYPSESFPSDRHTLEEGLDHCWKCFNNPCTCENKGRHRNPYDVKRSQDLHLEKVEKKQEEAGKNE